MELITNILASVKELLAGLGEFDAAGILGQVKDLIAGLNLDSIKDLFAGIIGIFG